MLEGEKNLVNRARKGEAEAFGLLYDHYMPQIFRFIYLKVSHREEAEDLTHQVFMKAWQNITNYEEQGFPFSSWLYQISRNQVIDYYRQKKPQLDIELVKENLFIDTLPDTDQKLEFNKIIKTLNKLTQEQKDVIIMHFINDQSIKEIANILKKSEGAIRLLQHRALNRLKKITKEKNSTT